MATTETCEITGYMQYEEKGETLEALSISTVTEFWLSAVNIF